MNDVITARERDILVMIKISPETVKSLVKRIFQELAVNTRTLHAVIARKTTSSVLRLLDACGKPAVAGAVRKLFDHIRTEALAEFVSGQPDLRVRAPLSRPVLTRLQAHARKLLREGVAIGLAAVAFLYGA